MKDFFRVLSGEGADLCEIRQDTKGQYLADCVQKCAAGVLFKVEKVHKARIGRATKTETQIIKIVSPPGKALGMDLARGEIHKIAFLKTMDASSMDARRIEVLISSPDALKMVLGDFSGMFTLVAIVHDTLIDSDLVLLEFNGVSFPVTSVAQLQLRSHVQLQKGEIASVTLARGF